MDILTSGITLTPPVLHLPIGGLLLMLYSGAVIVTASSVEVGSPAGLVARNPSEMWTKDIPGIN
jgi:hypothetical protein